MGIWYLLDEHDRIVEVGGDFDRFASENDGPHCQASQVVGQSLWSFIQGAEVRHLLRLLLQQAEVGSVRVPLRCDSPHELRLLEMEIVAQPPHRLVRFQPVLTQPNDPYNAPEPARLVTLCSWCNNVEVANGITHWLPVDQAAQALGLLVRQPQGITHGLCPACSAALAQPQDPKGFQHLQRGFRGI
jgi:hypothetical protein